MSIDQFLFPVITLFDINLQFELSENTFVSDITGLADISFMSKLLTIDTLDKFSDQSGCPVSYIKETNSPLLKGTIIAFSNATGDEVNRFFLFSDIV